MSVLPTIDELIRFDLALDPALHVDGVARVVREHALKVYALRVESIGEPAARRLAQFMAAALRTIHREPPPPAAPAAMAMLADMRAGVETYRVHMAERTQFARRAERLERPHNAVAGATRAGDDDRQAAPVRRHGLCERYSA